MVYSGLDTTGTTGSTEINVLFPKLEDIGRWKKERLQGDGIHRPFASDDWLRDLLPKATGIDITILMPASPQKLLQVSVATRMSWASQRETTRIEDIAYCLMGIFNVNMPLLYGEGDKAFIRLQEEIMRRSDDDSLFCWRSPYLDVEQYSGLLATAPECFGAFGKFSADIFQSEDGESAIPYALTNKGIQIQLNLISLGGNMYLATFNCKLITGGQPAIYLQRSSTNSKRFARVFNNVLYQAPIGDKGQLDTIFIHQDIKSPTSDGRWPVDIRIYAGARTIQRYRLVKLSNLHSDGSKTWDQNPDLRTLGDLTYNLDFGGGTVLGMQHLVSGEILLVVIGSLPGSMVGFSGRCSDDLSSSLELWRDENYALEEWMYVVPLQYM